MTPEERFERIEQNLDAANAALKKIADNQTRFDNALNTLLEQNASHESHMRDMEKRHNRHMRYLERIMERLSIMYVDHEDRLLHLEDDKPPQGGENAA